MQPLISTYSEGDLSFSEKMEYSLFVSLYRVFVHTVLLMYTHLLSSWFDNKQYILYVWLITSFAKSTNKVPIHWNLLLDNWFIGKKNQVRFFTRHKKHHVFLSPSIDQRYTISKELNTDGRDNSQKIQKRTTKRKLSIYPTMKNNRIKETQDLIYLFRI